MMGLVKDFLKTEAASSWMLFASAVLALIAANSPFAPYYDTLRDAKVSFIINDGLMAIFFLAVGIEIKHEMREGSLSTRAQALLPAMAALGGVIAPALIYAGFNWREPTLKGWAIPSATDIAFSLGALCIFAKRIPPALRIFLMAVAVMDDLVAVAIIAIFYTAHLNLAALAASAGCALLLYVYNWKNISQLPPYLLAGAALWCALVESGVHPTIAGVTLGLLMPLSLGKRVSNCITPLVAFGIVPLFAFANAGINLSGLGMSDFSHPVTAGIAIGLIAGKPAGILLVSALMIATKTARFPDGASWGQYTGVACLAGIGFTMSLFIGTMSFDGGVSMAYARLGVMTGSLVSALAGTICLMLSVSREKDIT